MIGIMTWYRACNHGAVLQAYASQSMLQSFGKDVCFLRYEKGVRSTIPLLKRAQSKIKRVLGGEITDKKNREAFERYKNCLMEEFVEQKFTVVEQNECDGLEAVMVGSDMVFSVREGFRPYMFGIGLSCPAIFSYAACSGGTTYEDVKRLGIDGEIRSSLSRFSGIGCRDITTQKFVAELLGSSKSAVQTIDPVLLYGFENELDSWDSGKWADRDPYLLIYAYYTNMNAKTEVVAIRAYAEKHGLRVISVGYFHRWCDENINASPEEFLEMVKYARAIVTDTFHGTIFSMIARKHFVSIVRENGFKLHDLLIKASMGDRIASADKLYEKLDDNTDFSAFDSWLSLARSESLSFLREQVD